MPPTINTIKVWVNAFIPRTVTGYRHVLGGPHIGKTAIDGTPGTPYAYLTDQRDFSNYIHADSRAHAEIKIDVTGSAPRIVSQWYHDHFTTEINVLTWNET